MFTLKEFIKKGLIEAVGNMPDYKIRLSAAGWLEKDVLTEADLVDIDTAIEGQYKIEEVI
jgi:hypothetical protein